MGDLANAYFDIYVVVIAVLGLWALLVGLNEACVALGVWGLSMFLMVGWFKATYKYCFPPKYDALMVIVNMLPLWFPVPLHFEYLFFSLIAVHCIFCLLALWSMQQISRYTLLKTWCSKPNTGHELVPTEAARSVIGTAHLHNSSDTEEEFV